MSFWRPVPPPGYVSLGDCMVTGLYAPPQSAVVLRDSDPTELLQKGQLPILARPRGYIRVRAFISAKTVYLHSQVLFDDGQT